MTPGLALALTLYFRPVCYVVMIGAELRPWRIEGMTLSDLTWLPA
jgi:hypothetical protein